MLMSLISMSDDEIERVTSAVRDWCRVNRCQIDSEEGRRAVTYSIDLVQTNPREPLLDHLIEVLGPFEGRPEETSGNEKTIFHSRGSTQTGS